MRQYPRITEIPTGDDLCWYADDSESNTSWCDSLPELIQQYRGLDIALIAGSSVFVAEKATPSETQFMPDADWVIDQIAETAYDDGDEYAEGWPKVTPEAKADLEATLRAWAEKNLPAPTWWKNTNIREYILTQADIDGGKS